MRSMYLYLVCLLAALGAAACGDDSDAGGAPDPGGTPTPQAPIQEPDVNAGPGATGVSQGGAQDFGLFRQILEAGQIPAPGVIDPLGFFAEHKLDYPAADCGDDLCLHGLLGIQGNMISGAACTVVQLGLNSPIRLADLERPPMDLVLAIDTSGSMRGEPIDFVRRGLLRMIDGLAPGDRVALVGYSDQAYTLLPEAAGEERQAIEAAINLLQARGSTNIYDGLYTAFDIAAQWQTPGRQSRVVLLSDGVATAGLESGERMKALAQAYARQGIGITTIGVGIEFDVDVMRALSEVGAGNFYFLEDPAAVEEVFAEEIATFLVPVALDVSIAVAVGGGYRVGQAYGTNGWTGGLTGGVIDIPSLFLAGRQSAAEPIEGGRRGGGGGILIELLPLNDQTGVEDPTEVGHLSMTWTDPQTRERMEQVVAINSPAAPGVIPAGGFFTDATVEKGFVMLNLLVGFQMAAELAYDADIGSAIGVLQALKPEVEAWLRGVEGDPDIEDDLRYLDLFVANLQRRGVEIHGSEPPVRVPPEPWPQD